jgi:virginiamycin B lyase
VQALISAGGTSAVSCPTATTIPFTSTIHISQDASGSPGRITFDGGGSSGSSFVYWPNTQINAIGRDTIDGNPLNVNQSIIWLGDPLEHNGPTDVEVDGQHLYWAGESPIGRANLDGSNADLSFITPFLGPDEIAVDREHIYWADPVGAGIARANLDGSGVNDSFIPGVDATQGLAVDGAHIYWAERTAARIGRANLDGSDVDQSFITGLRAPVEGVEVDGQYIYWADAAAGTVGRATIDGNPANVDASFIKGAISPADVAVDYQHVYWANQFVGPPSGGGTIGRANLDGSDADQSFINADSRLGPSCPGQPLDTRCGPESVAVSVPTGPDCLRQQVPPPPPVGGAVFARPLDANSQDANVVVLPAGSTWSGEGTCVGIALGAAEVMTHPTSISVAPGGAVLLRDQDAGLLSAWGAKNVGAGDPTPVLFPGRSDWKTTEANVVDPETLLANYNGCRACVLANNLHLIPGQPSPDVAYQQDLSGARLSRATLTGNFEGWNMSGANLTGAVLDHTRVDRAMFDRADLRGARLTALTYTAPPRFPGVRVGPFNGACTTFQDTDLLNARLTPARPDPGCETSPLLPGSTAPLDLLVLLAHTYGANVDFADARFVVDARNRGELAGVDLHGISLAGASFVGFPADFAKTKFDGASLQNTSFELADLSGATFANAHAAGASFRDGHLNGASFAGPTTDLEGADLVEADLTDASFQSADLTDAAVNRALAVRTDFNSVIAPGVVFDHAHIYGDGQAFEAARNLKGADFDGAVLAGDVGGGKGFDLTGADLTGGATFDGAQCIHCNFSGSHLDGAVFSKAYLPGAVLSGATLAGANLADAWLYCGDLSNTSCAKLPGSQPQWAWPLTLGSGETSVSVPFPTTALTGVSLADVDVCPDGEKPNSSTGCEGHLLPDEAGAPLIPAPCSAAGLGACPTVTKTLFDATSIGSPLAVTAAAPPTWATTLPSGRGSYVGLDDGTVRLVADDGSAQIVVAGSHGSQCPAPTQACGDDHPATQALLGAPTGLAVGLDGSLYLADPVLHRVRRIDPSGDISTVAGTGVACDPAAPACGDGGPATAAALAGPNGVWIDPSGDLWIADGRRGIREVLPDGSITTVGVGPGAYDLQSVAGDVTGNLYATTNNPDYLIKIDLATEQVTPVVGTGTSGYNGNTNSLGTLLPGTAVQIDQPQGLSIALNGNVVFADAGNSLIRAYVPPSLPSSSGHVIDLGGLVANDTPQAGFNGDLHPANQTELDHPQGVTVTRGALFVVADTHNTRLRQLGPNPPAPHLGGRQPRKPCPHAPATGRRATPPQRHPHSRRPLGHGPPPARPCRR